MQELIEVLAGGVIPSKKRAEVELMREAISLVSIQGRHQSSDAVERLHVLHAALKEARRYAEGAS